jgi:parallel beta-helix repeat protein
MLILGITTIASSNEISPIISAAHDPIDIDGNDELDAWAIVNSPGTDGLSWATAHVIGDYEIAVSGATYGIKIWNIDRYLIIRNCDVSNVQAYYGIYLVSCQNVKIIDCHVHDNTGTGWEGTGIRVGSSSYIIISDNTVERNRFGIAIFNSENCTISNNIAENNIDGFDLIGSDNNDVVGNTAKNNLCGIYLSNSDYNNISGNTVTNHDSNGIYLEFRCDNNEIYNNIVCNNEPNNITEEAQNNNNIYDNTCPLPAVPGYLSIIIISVIGLVLVPLIIIVSRKRIRKKKI